MLPGGYTAVLQARSRDEFRDEVVRFTQRLGFVPLHRIHLGLQTHVAVSYTHLDVYKRQVLLERRRLVEWLFEPLLGFKGRL